MRARKSSCQSELTGLTGCVDAPYPVCKALNRRNSMALERNMTSDEKYLDTREVAALTRFSPTYMAWLRQHGDGPRWVRAGNRKVIYALSDVRSWLDGRARKPIASKNEV
jgi:predicted DNA-binding transcriptional regulator AlpA